MKYELIESPHHPGHWHVEAFNDEGECIKAVFSGPDAKERATLYQQWCESGANEDFDYISRPSKLLDAMKPNTDYRGATGSELIFPEDGPFTLMCKKFGWDK